MNSIKTAQKRLPLLTRQAAPFAPRAGAVRSAIAQQIGDAFWRCAVEVAKVAYMRIDARFPFAERNASLKIAETHQQKYSEAKKILNEHRNDVLEAVLPMFEARLRKDEAESTADVHAHDYIVNNLFDMMVKTYKAWADEFVEQAEVDTYNRTIDKVAALQRQRLLGLLLNFVFEFKDLSVRQGKK